MVNIDGKMVGKDVVILGSGDIGLIMARRLTLEGAKVHAVLEINKTSSGLRRNIMQCLEDFNIPLLYSTTIFEVVGKDRVEGVWYGQVDEKFQPIEESKKFLKCDTVVLSVGLVPEMQMADFVPISRTTMVRLSMSFIKLKKNGFFHVETSCMFMIWSTMSPWRQNKLGSLRVCMLKGNSPQEERKLMLSGQKIFLMFCLQLFMKVKARVKLNLD